MLNSKGGKLQLGECFVFVDTKKTASNVTYVFHFNNLTSALHSC